MPDKDYIVNFPTLWVALDWIEEHCIVPDGFDKGKPFVAYDWQTWSTANHYRVKPAAKIGQRSTAFHYRRSQVVAPQKTGKGPWTATIVALEALGPTVFAGWAKGGERYDCADHGCYCGWVYEYEPGEPMAIPQPTPLIQITAFSAEQTDNIYRPLRAMLKDGPLSPMVKVGEEFTRLPNDGRIDVVTSSAQSRLGNPVTFVVQDETGIWTVTNKMTNVSTTQRRGVAGMQGRSLETTNCWDPSEDSVAQRTFESPSVDIFKFYRQPPAHLSYRNKAERRKIHRFVYKGSDHIDLDAIEGEAAELMEKEPEQAERFFGNRIVYGSGSYMDGDDWSGKSMDIDVPDGEMIVIGFDGSDSGDWTAIRAQTQYGHQFTPTYGPDNRPTYWNPDEWGGQVPRLEVDAAIDELMSRYKVVRGYFDPPYWETEIDAWAERYGTDVVIRFATYRPVQMHDAAERMRTDVVKADSGFSHDGCPITDTHVRNARKLARPSMRYVLGKPSQAQKIDGCVTSIICNEAAGDATAAGLWLHEKEYVWI